MESLAFDGLNPSSSTQQNDPCAQLVHILMCYHQGGEDPEFIRKAIESLVKKLKERREQLDTLISAVTSGGKQPTSCVTIHRSLDGRLQVAGRKGVPHVVYARIWRWPNVNKSELLKLPLCLTAADHSDLICVNPYHYERVVSTGLANIEAAICNDLPSNHNANSHELLDDPLLSTDSNLITSSSAGHTSRLSSAPAYHHPHHNCNSNSICLVPYADRPPSRLLAHFPNGNIVQNGNPVEHQSHIALYQNQMSSSHNKNLELIRMPQPQVPPEYWCSIAYFETDTQLGETFKASWTIPEVCIDGGTDPAGEWKGRFCVGALSNVHRSEASERARLHIGRGVRLRNTADGAVFLECLSQKGIFVRSYFLDFLYGLQYGSVVHKFFSGVERKIFDLRWAYAEMCEQRNKARVSAIARASFVAGIASRQTPASMCTGNGVDDLRRACCTLTMSFVKGWGAGYTRSSIKETPCWVEVQLHRPLQLLNELLQQTD